MHVLVVDSRPEIRERFIEVMSWFGGVKAVHEAASIREIEALSIYARIDAVIVGDIPQFAPDAAVRLLRLVFRSARIFAASAFESGPMIHDRLLDAGAESVVDLRMSIWKTGIVLRSLLVGTAAGPATEAGSPVPGLHVEVA